MSPQSSNAESNDLAIVEAELTRWSFLRLEFSPLIEARYEADMKAARAWNIRLTVMMGLIAYIAFCFVDSTLQPDLGWIPTLLRLFLVTPAGLFAIWMCSRASAAFREMYISVAITAAMMIPVGFIAASKASLAPYTMLVVLLVSMFGNITMRLRFNWACLFSFMTVTSVAAMGSVRTDLPLGLIGAIFIATITCVSFGIVANNQLERSERRSYLLALRETLRAEQHRRDKDVFSALSLADPMTGLANRRAFDIEFARLWRGWESNGQVFSMILIDVDHFKRYNDHYGHLAGDACLVAVSQALRGSPVRQQDIVARYGGEEFAILLPACGLPGALEVAVAFCEAIRSLGVAHINREDVQRIVTISAGVASVDGFDNAADQRRLLSLADENLYAAKSAGRNQAVASGVNQAA